MPELSLTLDGITAVIVLRGQAFTLTAKTRITASTPSGGDGSGAPQLPERIYFEYEKPYEEALNLGTPQEVFESLEAFLSELPEPPPGTPVQTLATQWDLIKQRLQGAPILNKVSTTVLDTQVRVTRLGLEFVRKVPLLDIFYARFSIGLMFTPAPESAPSLLGAKLTAFGGVVTVEAVGSAQQLGLIQ